MAFNVPTNTNKDHITQITIVVFNEYLCHYIYSKIKYKDLQINKFFTKKKQQQELFTIFVIVSINH